MDNSDVIVDKDFNIILTVFFCFVESLGLSTFISPTIFLLFSFQFGCIIFFLSNVLSRISSTVLSRSCVVVILALVLMIEENCWFVNTEYISCGLVKYGLYFVEVPSYHNQFDDSFYHERVFILLNVFYAYIDMIM